MTEFKINMVDKPSKKKILCPICCGDGQIMEYEGIFVECPQCFGRGELEFTSIKGNKKKESLKGLEDKE